MNLLKHFRYKAYGADVMASVARVEAVWAQARQRFGAGGPFLYGAFSAADAMYAPVVTRLDTYNWPVTPQSRAYMDAVLSCPPFLAWKADALAESWRIEAYEDGHTPV
jgi:glutathione S-transferase